MKPAAQPVSRRVATFRALTLLLAGPAAAQTTLLTDSFHSDEFVINGSYKFSSDLSVWNEDTEATEGTPVPRGEVETVPVTLSVLQRAPLPDKLFIQVCTDRSPALHH